MFRRRKLVSGLKAVFLAGVYVLSVYWLAGLLTSLVDRFDHIKHKQSYLPHVRNRVKNVNTDYDYDFDTDSY